MSAAYKDRGRGTYILDKMVRGVGRIKIASGTAHLPTFRRVRDMLEGLRENGRLDLLRAIKAGTLTPLVVWDAYRVNRLDTLPSPETLVPLRQAFAAFVRAHRCGEKHRASLRESQRHLEAHMRASASLVDLPTVLTATRAGLASEDKAQTFRLVKAACQAFVRAQVGKTHPLWSQVTGIDPLPITPKQHKRPQTVVELDAHTKDMDGEVSACLWSMATTGMGPEEYWSRWDRLGDRSTTFLHIAGEKRAARDRNIPDLGIALSPPITRPAFTIRFHKMHLPFSPYDMRRSFSNWMESAGIPRTRRRIYMGHGSRDVTDLYEWHEVRKFIEDDRKRLLAYLRLERAKAKLAKRSEISPSDHAIPHGGLRHNAG